ncbi:MAG TPA: hypothetical protein VED20_08590, partial [Streptosporangiaceae bacterium]|nr:hypothetical protein [Streptosporangiaceae bacterium]
GAATSSTPAPPPAAVKPAQQAGHQATQVSPVPTQVQAAQRPAAGQANGGTPANAKANGKEDEEDWWTE